MFQFQAGNTVVLKHGSEVVASELGVNNAVVDQIAELSLQFTNIGVFPIHITSGAIRTGKSLFETDNLDTSEGNQQALSSIGQVELISAYAEAHKKRGIRIGQILVDLSNFVNKKERLSLFNNLLSLRLKGATPIINENDAVATEEFVTDNDQIAVAVARLVGASALIITSGEIGGIEDENRLVISSVNPTVAERNYLYSCIRPEKSNGGRGGPKSKIDSCIEAARHGISALVMGKDDIPRIVNEAFYDNSFGTHFMAKKHN